MLIVPNNGELELLDKMLKDALVSDENYILKLFQNNVTPNQNFTSSSFIEANFTNYAAKTLTRSNWNSAVSVSGVANSSYGSSPQTWVCGVSGNTVYGYWTEGSNSGQVLWAEKFAVARILAEFDQLSIVPTFSLRSES